MLLNQPAPVESPVMKEIVKLGIKAVPALLKHLDDKRPTQLKPVKGMMWTQFSSEYDYNRRNPKPENVNKETDGIKSESYQIVVGDLCFVALGQIVNRGFNAARYQPSGGIVINSCLLTPALVKVAREEFGALTPEKHRQLLQDDLANPDHEGRRIGAYHRLSLYYPDAFETLVLKQLTVPAYDIFKVEPFVRQGLYKEKDAAQRKSMVADFLTKNGPAAKDGLLRELFEDLDTQEADEQKRISPPLKEKYLAREVLIESFEFPATVKSTDRPAPTHWELCEKARFIEALVHDKSKLIDEMVAKVFCAIEDNDYLALACIRRLINHGYDDDIIKYCKRRIPQAGDHTDDLEAILKLVKKD
jgi:hypothetical protein